MGDTTIEPGHFLSNSIREALDMIQPGDYLVGLHIMQKAPNGGWESVPNEPYAVYTRGRKKK